MCGLMGIISTEKLSKEMTSVYSTMMKLSVHRGKDSAGTLAVERKKDGIYYSVKKKAIHPDDYVRAADVKGFLSSTNHALLGHVRWATVGVVEEKTAHPYHIRPGKDSDDTELIGFHNGTIRGYKQTDDLTDSERFFKRLSSVGMKAALEELPRDSAYAFIVFNVDTGTFSFFRNDRREVFMAASKDSKTLIYASEKRIITAALEYEDLKDKFEAPGLLPRNQLIKFEYEGDSIKIKASSNYLSDEVIKKHEEATVVRPSGGHSFTWDGSSGEWVESSGRSPRPPVPRLLPPTSHRTTPQGNVLDFKKESAPSGPFPVTLYKYSPLTREVAREHWLTKVNSKLTRFWEANASYKHEYELCKLYSIVSRGGCWLELDESSWDFIVHLPSGKQRIIKCTDDRWEGWWKVMEMLDGLWEDQADFCRSMNHRDMIVSAEMLHDFNSLHSMASRFCVDTKKDRPSDEVISPVSEEGKDEIPFEEVETGEEEKYLSYGYREVEVEEAQQILKSGCMNCLEHSSIDDIVYWTSSSTYVCEGCSEMVAVHLGVNMMDATIGRMKDKNVLHRFN